MRAKIDVMTQHMMRDYMPDEHRAFFEGLEYIFLGTVDQNDMPHASIVTGQVGFATTPDPKRLVVQTGPRDGLPAFDGLAIGQPVGVLGLDLSNRRRNRMHGQISALDNSSITIAVIQSYGNCPKYISLRNISDHPTSSTKTEASERLTLESADTDLIAAADTFFIASYVRDGSGAPYEGVDVNHRGGQPGFVSVDSPSQITVPDYKGNYLFNTFGNLLLNPDTGILFIDFETGDQLHLHGQAELIEDEDSVVEFPGAQRLLRVEIKSVRRHAKATELRWDFIETSPVNPTISPNEE
jgi:hypothetical protein